MDPITLAVMTSVYLVACFVFAVNPLWFATMPYKAIANKEQRRELKAKRQEDQAFNERKELAHKIRQGEREIEISLPLTQCEDESCRECHPVELTDTGTPWPSRSHETFKSVQDYQRYLHQCFMLGMLTTSEYDDLLSSAIHRVKETPDRIRSPKPAEVPSNATYEFVSNGEKVRWRWEDHRGTHLYIQPAYVKERVEYEVWADYDYRPVKKVYDDYYYCRHSDYKW